MTPPMPILKCIDYKKYRGEAILCVNISNLLFSSNILATTNLGEKPSCRQGILLENKSITIFI